ALAWYLSWAALTPLRQEIEAALALGSDAPATLRARALLALGMETEAAGDTVAARAALQDCVALARAVDDARLLAGALGWLATAVQADPEAARASRAECLDLLRRTDDRWTLALLLLGTSHVALSSGPADRAAARATLEECIALLQELGDHNVVAA